jgi:hypothetical protein
MGKIVASHFEVCTEVKRGKSRSRIYTVRCARSAVCQEYGVSGVGCARIAVCQGLGVSGVRCVRS